MSKPKDTDVAKWVENRARNLEPQPLRDVLMVVLTTQFTKNSRLTVSAEQIAEWAEDLEVKVALRLAEIDNDYVQQGVDPAFKVEIDDGDHYYCCKESPDHAFRAKLAAMTPDGFEHFCKAILNKLSGNAVVTGGAYDGGIDFYALGLPLAGAAGLFPRASKLFVIGQAKRWQIQAEVSPNDLRQFVGASILRAEQLRRDHADRCGLLTPTSFAFWATCDFSTGARDFAEEMGLWYLNGKALSQLAIRIGLGEQSIVDAEAEVLRR